MLRSLAGVVRRRPRTTVLLLTLVLLAGAGAGLYGYALYQWRAAGDDLKGERPREARRRLGVCLLLWPHDPRVQLRAARAARLTGDYAAAEAHLKECTRLERGATQAIQLEFLLMRVQRGEEEEVESALFQFVENKHPDRFLILDTLARSYMRNLRYGPAHACLTRWIKEAPDNPRPCYWRGWVLERLNNHKQAMRDYRRALELDPELAQVRLRVAEILLEDKQPREALPHLLRLRKQFPRRADVMARLGQCYYLQGRQQEARQLLEAAVKQLPNDPQLLLHLARLELVARRPARAEQWLRRALKVNPFEPDALYSLATSLRYLGREKEADDALTRYKKMNGLLQEANQLLQEEAKSPSQDPAAACKIGGLLLRIGQEDRGLYWLDQALLRQRGYKPAHEALANYFEKKGDRVRAAAHRRLVNEPTGKAVRMEKRSEDER
jgi:predicted Zn-dependent protease